MNDYSKEEEEEGRMEGDASEINLAETIKCGEVYLIKLGVWKKGMTLFDVFKEFMSLLASYQGGLGPDRSYIGNMYYSSVLIASALLMSTEDFLLRHLVGTKFESKPLCLLEKILQLCFIASKSPEFEENLIFAHVNFISLLWRFINRWDIHQWLEALEGFVGPISEYCLAYRECMSPVRAFILLIRRVLWVFNPCTNFLIQSLQQLADAVLNSEDEGVKDDFLYLIADMLCYVTSGNKSLFTDDYMVYVSTILNFLIEDSEELIKFVGICGPSIYEEAQGLEVLCGLEDVLLTFYSSFLKDGCQLAMLNSIFDMFYVIGTTPKINDGVISEIELLISRLEFFLDGESTDQTQILEILNNLILTFLFQDIEGPSAVLNFLDEFVVNVQKNVHTEFTLLVLNILEKYRFGEDDMEKISPFFDCLIQSFEGGHDQELLVEYVDLYTNLASINDGFYYSVALSKLNIIIKCLEDLIGKEKGVSTKVIHAYGNLLVVISEGGSLPVDDILVQGCLSEIVKFFTNLFFVNSPITDNLEFAVPREETLYFSSSEVVMPEGYELLETFTTVFGIIVMGYPGMVADFGSVLETLLEFMLEKLKDGLIWQVLTPCTDLSIKIISCTTGEIGCIEELLAELFMIFSALFDNSKGECAPDVFVVIDGLKLLTAVFDNIETTEIDCPHLLILLCEFCLNVLHDPDEETLTLIPLFTKMLIAIFNRDITDFQDFEGPVKSLLDFYFSFLSKDGFRNDELLSSAANLSFAIKSLGWVDFPEEFLPTLLNRHCEILEEKAGDGNFLYEFAKLIDTFHDKSRLAEPNEAIIELLGMVLVFSGDNKFTDQLILLTAGLIRDLITAGFPVMEGWVFKISFLLSRILLIDVGEENEDLKEQISRLLDFYQDLEI